MAEPPKREPAERRAFVIGCPIDHSRSPIIHGFWLKKYNLNGSYEKVHVDPESLGHFLATAIEAGFVGGNITIPHKENANHFVAERDDIATTLGAINTVWISENRLIGSNTDGYGFLANLDDQSPGWDHLSRKKRGALVVGAGGASRAIIFGLAQRGFDPIIIANRTFEKAEHLVKKFGRSCHAMRLDQLPEVSASVSMIVNTTSLGMEATTSDEFPIDFSQVAADAIVHDIVYTPLTTPFLAAAKERGLTTIDGLGMLLHQAVPGFEKWFGIRPDVTKELRQILLRDLGELENE